ncbi:hypothetical protein RJT34_13827 [Clitoria ternatea]|uniref:Uncharacterized protein n=1 Tax=Clitoria ternatea TaxID=43366 RepID=A0AAN9PKJ0_CLITE
MKRKVFPPKSLSIYRHGLGGNDHLSLVKYPLLCMTLALSAKPNAQLGDCVSSILLDGVRAFTMVALGFLPL